MNEKLLILDSKKYLNNKFALDNFIQGMYKLVSFVSTNNMYNVNDTNNKIYLNESGSGNLTAILTNGYYDPTDFISQVSATLNNVCSGTITVSRNSNTNKLTINNNSFAFYFTFGSNTNNSARKLLGFNEEDGAAGSTSQISDNPMDLNTCKNIFITFEEDNDRNIEGINFFNSSLLIQGNGNFGEILRYKEIENFSQYVKFKTTKALQISFSDIDDNTINLNSDYQIILRKLQ